MADDIETMAREVLDLDAKATPGPWAAQVITVPPYTRIPCAPPFEGSLDDPRGTESTAADARFVAFARTAAPALAREVLDLRARLVEVERQRDEVRAEVAQLQAGGCARDQRTTQWCAEAVQAQQGHKAAVKAAGQALVFNDDADYEQALWEVLEALAPEVADAIEKHLEGDGRMDRLDPDIRNRLGWTDD